MDTEARIARLEEAVAALAKLVPVTQQLFDGDASLATFISQTRKLTDVKIEDAARKIEIKTAHAIAVITMGLLHHRSAKDAAHLATLLERERESLPSAPASELGSLLARTMQLMKGGPADAAPGEPFRLSPDR